MSSIGIALHPIEKDGEMSPEFKSVEGCFLFYSLNTQNIFYIGQCECCTDGFVVYDDKVIDTREQLFEYLKSETATHFHNYISPIKYFNK